jgi:hypothetical protein
MHFFFETAKLVDYYRLEPAPISYIYLMQKLTLIFLFFILPAIALAQNDLITVSSVQGSVKVHPSLLKRTTLKALGNDGKEHIYTGALLSGCSCKSRDCSGEQRESINSYIITRAKDNYTTIFSLAEIDPLFAKADILVADKIDDKTLTPPAFPF